MIRGRPLRARWALSLALALIAGCTILLAPSAAATPTIDRVEHITDRWVRVFVDSPAMGGPVEVQLLLPRNTSAPRPTLYLLDGRSADGTGNHWADRGNAVQFFEDKNVNVVMTVGGTASYYTDWQQADRALGTYKWETFLTKELPPLIDSRFGGNGVSGVAGVSMGAQAAMMLAFREPQLYRAVAGYSGCYASTDDVEQAQMRLVVASAGGNANNMFGQPEAAGWAAHDAVAHADQLRGKTIYLSAGSGVPGPHDGFATPETTVLGGPIEASVNACTHHLADRLGGLGVPATVAFRQQGTHSWPYWADELRSSWPVLAGGLGVTG